MTDLPFLDRDHFDLPNEPHRDFFDRGTVLLIDKEAGWTSFDAVHKIRNLTRAKRVGHAGTLDPFATGLLIVVTGKATKSVDQYSAMEKIYETVFELGTTTDTLDITGTVISQKEIPPFQIGEIQNVLASLSGEIEQRPPEFSAIKVKGTPAYKLARKGKPVELRPRKVMIFELAELSYEQPLLNLRVRCSKGTYIRSLARDLGEKLGCGAFVRSLRRTGIGKFRVEQALTMTELTKRLKN